MKTYCEKFGTVPVERYDDMVDKVDGIMLTDLRAGEYFHLLAAPYLKAGIPVFFNRCFTPRLGGARAIVELSKNHATHYRRIWMGIRPGGLRPAGGGGEIGPRHPRRNRL